MDNKKHLPSSKLDGNNNGGATYGSTLKDNNDNDRKPTSIIDGGIISSTNHNEFNLDRQEYQQVFKVFDKDNSGEITIQQVYELINKFEANEISASAIAGGNQGFADANGNVIGSNQGSISGQGGHYGIHFQASGVKGSKGAYTAGKSYGHGNSSYNNSSQYMGKDLKSKPQNGDSVAHGHSNSSTFHNNRQANNRTGNSVQNQYTKTNGYGGSNVPGANATQQSNNNIMQLRPTQLTTNTNNTVNSGKNHDIIHKSPRRQSYLYNNKTDKSGQMQIKLNGIGGQNNNNHNSIRGSEKSDPQSNEDAEEATTGSPGIQSKKQRIAGASNSIHQNNNPGSNSQQITSSSTPQGQVMEFPNGKETLKFEEFIGVIRDSCTEKELAENYLILAFSMFDRQKKGYISTEDLKEVFEILGENVSDEELNTMIKIAGIKSNDKINFKEFVDFFYKID